MTACAGCEKANGAMTGITVTVKKFVALKDVLLIAGGLVSVTIVSKV